MSKRKVFSLLVIVLLFSIFSIILLNYISKNSQVPQIPYKSPQLIGFNMEYLTSRDVNLTESTEFTLNLTITSYADKQLVIPLGLDLFSIFRDGIQDTKPEVSGFDYWFEPSSIVIEPFGNNSTLLTVEFSSDADTVEYDFRILFGNSDEHHVGGTALRVDVTS